MIKKSPFAPASNVIMHPVKGVDLSAVACQLKESGKPDLVLVTLPEGASIGGVFTCSSTAAAPVDWCRNILQHAKARAIVVHAGNANAFTGSAGYELVTDLAANIADRVRCKPDEVYIAATGIIGRQVPRNKIFDALDSLVTGLDSNRWYDAAEAIMTTDTYVKVSSHITTVAEARVTVTGFAKGSGMIMPNMATMLAFVFTDLDVPSSVLQTVLAECCDKTFNCITVDSDTSTNDTLLLVSSRQQAIAGEPIRDAADPRLASFKQAIFNVLHELALAVVKDGEGISKLIKITVRGAVSDASARQIGFSVANSPLVKTAIAGGDANWGRIVMAVGKSKEPVSKNLLSVAIGGIVLGAHGSLVELVDPKSLDTYMQGQHIDIDIELGVGSGQDTVWTTDLTHEYIAINADYRT